MYTTQIPRLGVTLSRLGFGAMRLPMGEGGGIDRETATRMLDHAYQNGVNYFDTGYLYLKGESELFLSEYLRRHPRDSYYLADKLPVWLVESQEDCRRIFEDQLRRCGVDHFDFYLLHAMRRDRWFRLGELGIFQVLDQYRREGRIRFLGYSFHDTPEAFSLIAEGFDWDFAMIQTNYVDEVLLDAGRIYRWATQREMPLMVMEPIRGGALARLPDNIRGVLDEAPTRYTPAQWALRWCLGHDNMRVVLSGMNTLEQVEENVALFSSAPVLNQRELALLHRARDLLMAAKTVPCTGCGYCTDCPGGVDIPGIFTVYNHYRLFENKLRAKTDYSLLGREHQAASCVDCGACVRLCPQHIDIPREIRKVHQTIAALQVVLQDDIPDVEPLAQA